MIFTPYPHIISDFEIDGIKARGFLFEGSSIPAVEFINTRFPNFDLLAVLDAINVTLSPTTSTTIYKKVILEEGLPPAIEIQFFSDDYADENNGLALVRTFTWEDKNLVVKHEFFRLPRRVRRTGISKKILLPLMQQYINMGVRKILVHAALEDGGFVWAKQFFMATKVSEVNLILAHAKGDLTPLQYMMAKRIYDNYYVHNTAGQSFPMYKWAELPFMEPILRSSTWHGAVDLTNPIELGNFTTHAFG
jgi:hypothetical protein